MVTGDLSSFLWLHAHLRRTVKDSSLRSKHCQMLNLEISDTESQFVSLTPFGSCDGQSRHRTLSHPAASPAALSRPYFSFATTVVFYSPICCALCYSHLSDDLFEDFILLKGEEKN